MPRRLRSFAIFLAFWQCFFVSYTLAQPSASPGSAPGLAPPVRIGGVLENGGDWAAYKARFLHSSGRIIDTGNNGVSHSEGQGYGMLLAAAAGDRAAFDAVWSWTKSHLLIRRDSLAAWKWTGGVAQTVDANDASDGDILIAWALAEAADYWNEPAFLQEARRITSDILAKTVIWTRNYGPILVPGARGFSPDERSDGQVVNLSYWVYPAFARLAQVEPSYDWRSLAEAGLALSEKARFGPSHLPPDWLSLVGDKLAPAAGFNARFGYDALRIPLYMFWADMASPQRVRFFANAWSLKGAQLSLVGLPTVGADQQSDIALKEPGYRAVAAIARCAAMNLSYPDEFYRFSANQNYYPATMHLLSVIAAAARGGPCLDREKIRYLLSDSWRPQAGSLAKISALASPPPTRYSAPVDTASIYVESAVDIEPEESLQNIPEDTGPVFYFRVAAGVMISVVAFVWLIRRRGAPEQDSVVDEKEELVSQAVSAIGPALAGKQLPLAPRTLPQSPFTPTRDIPTLGREIEVAAVACVRLSRTIGLIYFEIPSFAEFEMAVGSVEADAKVEALAKTFRAALRATDNVAVLNRNQILVCICLLANALDLKNVASRLRGIAMGSEFEDVGHLLSGPGCAVYPLNGYEGVTLIDSARRDCERQGPRPAPAPYEAASPAEIPASEEKPAPHSQKPTHARKRRNIFTKKTTPRTNS